MTQVGLAAGVMGAGILAGVGLAVKAWADFDARMANVRTLSGATADEMDVLANAALTMGQNIGLSANDVADAETELVKAGVSVKDIMGGALAGALNLAAAGQIEVGQATEIATIALTQFKLAGSDIPHVADLLAAGADKALGGVDELGMALKQGGLVAASFGLSIDDTVGTLSAFANAGLLGSDAGTSFKTMLLALANPSKQAARTMEDLGINAYDAQGQFVGITGLAGQLQEKMKGLSQEQRNAALATIFGTDAIRSANVLYTEGAAGIQKWITNVNDQGFAAVQAAGKMDSLNGDFKKLQAAVTNGLIEMGSTADGFLRPVIQAITDAVKTFNQLPEPVKASGMAIAGIVGGALVLGGAFLTLAPKVASAVESFQSLTKAAPRVSGAMGQIGKAASIAAGTLVALQVAHALFTAKDSTSAADYAEAIMKVSNSADNLSAAGLDSVFTKFSKSLGTGESIDGINGVSDAINRLTHQNFSDWVNTTFLGDIGRMAGAQSDVDKIKEKLGSLGTTMGNLVTGGDTKSAAATFNALTEEFKKNGQGAQQALDALPAYRDALKDVGNAAKVSLEPQELLELAAGRIPPRLAAAQKATEMLSTSQEVAAKQSEAQQKALEDVGLTAAGTIGVLDKFVESMVAAGLMTMSARDAEVKFNQSVAEVKSTVEDLIKTNGSLSGVLNKNKTDFDLTTEAGQKANNSFQGVAQAGISAAEALAKNGASNTEVQAKLQGTYNSLVAAAGQFGITGSKATDLARKILGVPAKVNINTWMSDYARIKAQELGVSLNNVPKSVTIGLNINSNIATVQANLNTLLATGRTGTKGGLVAGFAGGGAIEGPGAKGVDSQLIKAAPGEHMFTAQDVDLMGGQDAVYAFRRSLRQGTVQQAAPKVTVAPVAAPAFPSSLTLRVDGYEFKAYVAETSAKVAGSMIQRNNGRQVEPV